MLHIPNITPKLLPVYITEYKNVKGEGITQLIQFYSGLCRNLFVSITLTAVNSLPI